MQLSSDTEPVFSVVMPSGQSIQARAVSVSRYLPIGHSVHVSPPSKNLPLGHGSENPTRIQFNALSKTTAYHYFHLTTV